MAAPAPEGPQGGGLQGGGLAQKVQQVESILAEISAEIPDPAIQRMVHEVQQPLEGLQQAVGQIDASNMQSGVSNPTEGGGGEAGSMGGHEEPDGDEGSAPHGGPALVIHIGAGGPKDFKSANKAAMANMKSKGHFNPHGAAGEEQSTQRSRYRAGK